MSQEQFNKYKDFCNKIISSTELHDGSDYDKTCGMCRNLLEKVRQADSLRPDCLKRTPNEYRDPVWFDINLGSPLESEGENAVKDILNDSTLNFEDIQEEGCQTLDYEDKRNFLENLFGSDDNPCYKFNLSEITSVIYYLKDYDEAHIKWRKALVKAMVETLEFAIDVQLQWDEEDFIDYTTLSGRCA